VEVMMIHVTRDAHYSLLPGVCTCGIPGTGNLCSGSNCKLGGGYRANKEHVLVGSVISVFRLFSGAMRIHCVILCAINDSRWVLAEIIMA
jgi:hypothetical protein